MGDDRRPCRPSTAETGANIEKVGKIVRRNRRLSIRAFDELINIDKETVPREFTNNFNMKKLARRWCRESSLTKKRKFQ